MQSTSILLRGGAAASRRACASRLPSAALAAPAGRSFSAAAAAAAPPPPSLVKQFEDACASVGPTISASGSDDTKLKAYALFKQAREGDAPAGGRPGAFDFVARAKYDAWAKLAGTSRSDAMSSYIAAFVTKAGGAAEGGDSASADVPATPMDKHKPVGAFLPAITSPMLPPGTFAGKVALVTGGGTGLGRAIAHTLSALGATVIICSRKLDVLTATAAAISGETGNAVHAVACDVRDPEAVARAVDEGVGEWVRAERCGVYGSCETFSAGVSHTDEYCSPMEIDGKREWNCHEAGGLKMQFLRGFANVYHNYSDFITPFSFTLLQPRLADAYPT